MIANRLLKAINRAERSRLESLKNEKQKIDGEFENGLQEEIQALTEAIGHCRTDTEASTKTTE
jgi:hypothetical protein